MACGLLGLVPLLQLKCFQNLVKVRGYELFKEEGDANY